MAVKGTKNVTAEKYLKSKVGLKVVLAFNGLVHFVLFLSCTKSGLKAPSSKLARMRAPVQHPKYNKQTAQRSRPVLAPRHTSMASTPVVYGERGWGATSVTSCHAHNLQPRHPPTATSRSQAQILQNAGGGAISPVHVALPLGRPRIMPSSAIHPGPSCKAICTRMPHPQAPPPNPSPSAQPHRLKVCV